jgi:hypothetical protein
MRRSIIDLKHMAIALGLAGVLVCGCAKQSEPAKDSIEKDATGPAAGRSSIGAVNKARSTADDASSKTYTGDEGGK